MAFVNAVAGISQQRRLIRNDPLGIDAYNGAVEVLVSAGRHFATDESRDDVAPMPNAEA